MMKRLVADEELWTRRGGIKEVVIELWPRLAGDDEQVSIEELEQWLSKGWLRRWRAGVRQLDAHAALLGRATLLAACMALRCWMANSAARGFDTALVEGAARHSRRRLRTYALARWRRAAASGRRVRSALLRMVSHRVCQAWNSWRQIVLVRAACPSDALVTSVMGSASARALSAHFRTVPIV